MDGFSPVASYNCLDQETAGFPASGKVGESGKKISSGKSGNFVESQGKLGNFALTEVNQVPTLI